MRKVFFLVLFLSIPGRVFASDVHITEVLFNPAGSDTGAEYVVIKNIGADTKELTGWQLYPDGIGYFTFPSFSLDAGASVKIFLRQSGNNSATALYHQTPAANMGNTSGSVALFSSTQHDASTLIDFMQYGRAGETWETNADEAGLWIKGEFISIHADEEGMILRRSGDTHMTSAWQGSIETANETDSSGTQEDSLSSDDVKENTGAGGKISSGPVFTPKIRAFAGSDRVSIAGAEVVFSGRALDDEDALIESQLVRYMWNFGDGTFAEGKNVVHAYLYPGTYTATLIIVQGEDMMQDECLVRVGDNTVRINEVLPGPQGWIELANISTLSVDISKWYLQDASGSSFLLPVGTRIAGGGFVVLANDTTKVAQNSSSVFPITLRYQNAKEADSFMYSGAVSAGLSAARSEGEIVLGQKTPGLQNSIRKEKTVLVAASKPEAVVANPPVLAQETTTPAVLHEEREIDQQASVFNTVAAGPAGEMKWLLASILAGLFVGLSALFIRARRLQQ
ncbi:MAG: lamin tail domain-containing protein [Patescibacteria group bacterium]